MKKTVVGKRKCHGGQRKKIGIAYKKYVKKNYAARIARQKMSVQSFYEVVEVPPFQDRFIWVCCFCTFFVIFHMQSIFFILARKSFVSKYCASCPQICSFFVLISFLSAKKNIVNFFTTVKKSKIGVAAS